MGTLGTSTTQPRRADPIVGDRRQVTNRRRTARGHVDDVLSMAEQDGWCPDVAKQLTAAQGLIESTSREVSRHHLGSPIYAACCDGCGDGAFDELLEALKYAPHALRATP